ncbi:MAG: DUF2750 domain-containing protein [Planctomycetes bacterium]|nr:DUF2750 domain-containing protein [Planctomycetota bacterium]
MMRLSAHEFQALVRCSGEARYKYWIRRVADFEEVWSLADDSGWVLAQDGDGHVAVPVWSHPEYARACAEREWAGNHPRAIALMDWMGKWLPGIAKDKRLVAVFPVPDGQGVFVTAERVRRDLEKGLESYA